MESVWAYADKIVAERIARLDLAETHVSRIGARNIDEAARESIVNWVQTGSTDAPPWAQNPSSR